jgi:hypothetical protein
VDPPARISAELQSSHAGWDTLCIERANDGGQAVRRSGGKAVRR